MTDDELMDELKKRVDEERYAAGCLEGIPGDEPYEVIDTVNYVLKHLGQQVMVTPDQNYEPHGPNTAPDVGNFTLDNGNPVVVEVTKLVDRRTREKHLHRRRIESAMGLSQRDVFDTFMQTSVDPVQAANENVVRFDDRERWDEVSLAAAIDYLVQRKDTNNHLLSYAEKCPSASIWCAIQTAEPHINDHPNLLPKAIALLKYRPITIKRVFVVLDYVPDPTSEDGRYPVIEILY